MFSFLERAKVVMMRTTSRVLNAALISSSTTRLGEASTPPTIYRPVEAWQAIAGQGTEAATLR